MKQTLFSEEERSLLKKLLPIRLEHYREEYARCGSDRTAQRKFNTSYLKPLEAAFCKVSVQEDTTLFPSEKNSIISCVVEHYNKFKKGISLNAALCWLRISDDQRKVVLMLDVCIEIMSKCNYFTKKELLYDQHFRYGNLLSAADRLKECDKILLAKTFDNEYYKIAFVYDEKEYLPFKFGNSISRDMLDFIPFGVRTLEEIKDTKFDVLVSKIEAKELLASRQWAEYEKDSLAVVDLLLNYNTN